MSKCASQAYGGQAFSPVALRRNGPHDDFAVSFIHEETSAHRVLPSH